jgi:tetratricopeptide (TPR) repeat protein
LALLAFPPFRTREQEQVDVMTQDGAGGARPPRRPRPPGGAPRTGDRRPAVPDDRPYDPRREARRLLTRVHVPEDVEARELDAQTRKQLLGLSKETADLVARHLVMAGRLMDEAPDQALRHARAATAMAGRVGAVREANGLVAYVAGEWAEALAELRAARRITGEPDHLAVMADCERALGRPDRALAVAEDKDVARLDPAARIELLIVCSGARRDRGQLEAAAHMLEIGSLTGPVKPWTGRLRYAYADALLALGREDEARHWFAAAAEADPDGETDAEDRLLELDGLVLEDLQPDHHDDTPVGDAD